jgi:hypothetical protein
MHYTVLQPLFIICGHQKLLTIAIVWKSHFVYSVNRFPVFRGNLLSPPSTLHMGVVSFREIVVIFYKPTLPQISDTDIFMFIVITHSNTEQHL